MNLARTFWLGCALSVLIATSGTAAVVDDLIIRSNTLGETLLIAAQAQSPTQNTIIAAPSVMVTLGIIGSGTSGKTKTAWQSAMGVSRQRSLDINRGFSLLQSLLTDPALDVTLNSDNWIWVAQSTPPKDSFIISTHEYFDATIQPISFKSAVGLSKIQKAIAGATRQRLKNVPHHIDPSTSILAINTLYFNGEWKTPFNRAQSDNRFFLGVNGPVKTEFMVQKGRFQTAQNETTQAIILPYASGRFELVIVAPTHWDPAQLPFKWLTDTPPVPFEDTEALVILPKLKLSTTISLRDPLTQVGLSALFSAQADYTNISPGLQLSDMQHHVMIECDEEGTVAAAATGGTFTTTSAPPTSTQIVLTRPFLFGIRDTISGLYIFIGTYITP